MKWPVFAIAAFVFVVAQLSLRSVFTLNSIGGVSPNLVAIFAVFVCLFATRSAALWACWMLGMALDLAPQAHAASIHVIGPNTLGFVAGGLIVLQLRAMVFRRRALTIGLLTLLFVIGAAVIAVFILALRNVYDAEPAIPGGPLAEFARRLGVALYSAILAIPLGWLLSVSIPLWSFPMSPQRR